ncbi:hypothetical protein Droror1_Dr00009866 [Drosera rotundifolia]
MLIDNLLRGVLWQSVSNVYMISCVGSDFAKEVMQKLKSQKQDPRYCRSCNQKCWRQYLKDVVSFPPNDIENKIFEVDDFNRAIPRPKLTSLELTWEEGCKKERCD